MAKPVFIDCTKNIWTKVATGVTTGQIHKKSEQPQEYLHTYRDTGGAAPPNTEAGKEQGVPIFLNGVSELISATAGIDIYVYPVSSDGKVRVDT